MVCRIGRGQRVVQGHVEDHRDDEHAEHIEHAAGRDLAVIKTARDLHPALCRITDSYYRMFMDVPVMRDIWQATQADRSLQKLDEEDGIYLAGLLGDALRRIAPDAPATALASFSQLIMTLIAATVRHAITQDAKEAARILTLFKRMLPKNLAALEM